MEKVVSAFGTAGLFPRDMSDILSTKTSLIENAIGVMIKSIYEMDAFLAKPIDMVRMGLHMVEVGKAQRALLQGIEGETYYLRELHGEYQNGKAPRFIPTSISSSNG